MLQSIRADRNGIVFQQAEDLFQRMLETVPCAMFVTKDKGKIYYVNRQAELLTGYEKQELIGSRMVAIVPSFTDTEANVKEEHSLFHRGGRKVPIEISGTDIDGILGNCSVLALMEISERLHWKKRVETLEKTIEKYEEEYNKSVHNLVHDLKEPLRAITSYTQLLERQFANELDEDTKDFFRFIIEGAKRMGQMIEKLRENEQISRHSSR